MKFYALHRQYVIIEQVIRIEAKNKSEAEKINRNWSIGTKDPKIKVIDRDSDVTDYTAYQVSTKHPYEKE